MEFTLIFPENEHLSDRRRMASGGYGLPKVSPGPAMPYSSMPCSRFKVISPADRVACGHLQTLWTPHASASDHKEEDDTLSSQRFS
jgi:hypothetical protein